MTGMSQLLICKFDLFSVIATRLRGPFKHDRQQTYIPFPSCAFLRVKPSQDSIGEPEPQTAELRTHRERTNVGGSLVVSCDGTGDDQLGVFWLDLAVDAEHRAGNRGHGGEQ